MFIEKKIQLYDKNILKLVFTFETIEVTADCCKQSTRSSTDLYQFQYEAYPRRCWLHGPAIKI